MRNFLESYDIVGLSVKTKEKLFYARPNFGGNRYKFPDMEQATKASPCLFTIYIVLGSGQMEMGDYNLLLPLLKLLHVSRDIHELVKQEAGT
ncbi:hypothetical protein DFQ30_009554 [Apophysomyces sp. BC1015]|nr:hypothetical protein DFQ30_009554 [Apophysomyces sp. BC1015]